MLAKDRVQPCPQGAPTEQSQRQEYFLEEVAPSCIWQGQQELVRPQRAGRVCWQKEHYVHKMKAQRQTEHMLGGSEEAAG